MRLIFCDELAKAELAVPQKIGIHGHGVYIGTSKIGLLIVRVRDFRFKTAKSDRIPEAVTCTYATSLTFVRPAEV